MHRIFVYLITVAFIFGNHHAVDASAKAGTAVLHEVPNKCTIRRPIPALAFAKPSLNVSSNVVNGLKNGLASGLASCVAKCMLQPFDTIKTIQQRSTTSISLPQAGYKLISERGFFSLYSGLFVTLAGSIPSVGVYFGTYQACKQYFTESGTFDSRSATIAVSAAIGNTLAAVVRVPCEVVKQRIQAGIYYDTASAIRSLFADGGGLFGLYGRGNLWAQVIRDVPYAIVTLLTYEALQTKFMQKQTQTQTQTPATITTISTSTTAAAAATAATATATATAASNTADKQGTAERREDKDKDKNKDLAAVAKQILIGGLAGGVGTFCSNPMDVVKTRLMTTIRSTADKEGALALSRGGLVGTVAKDLQLTLSVGHKIWTEGGALAFFRGVTPRLCHKIPANAIFFLAYEFFRALLNVR